MCCAFLLLNFNIQDKSDDIFNLDDIKNPSVILTTIHFLLDSLVIQNSGYPI